MLNVLSCSKDKGPPGNKRFLTNFPIPMMKLL